MLSQIHFINKQISGNKEINMSNINSSNQESNPQKESNQDKGKHDLYKNTEPQKKPNTEPDHPLREQK